MTRLLVIARNSDFPRLGARPVSNATPASPSLRPDNCEAGLSSGMTPEAAAGGPRTTQRGSSALLAPLFRPKARVCPDCDGQGQVFVHDFYDGFERNRRWEACETCNGDGYEPIKEDDND